MHGIEPNERGSRLNLHVAPRASRTRIVGFHGDRIKLQVAAPPVDGQANDAIVRFLADSLGVPRDAIRVASGATGKRKAVLVAGLTPEEVAERLGLDALR